MSDIDPCDGTGWVECWNPGGPCAQTPPCDFCGPCRTCEPGTTP